MGHGVSEESRKKMSYSAKIAWENKKKKLEDKNEGL